MPIIVDEIVISLEVANQAAGGAGKGGASTEDQQALIEACAERVLDILRQKGER